MYNVKSEDDQILIIAHLKGASAQFANVTPKTPLLTALSSLSTTSYNVILSLENEPVVKWEEVLASHERVPTWPWALWNDIMVKGGVYMDTPTLVQSDIT